MLKPFMAKCREGFDAGCCNWCTVFAHIFVHASSFYSALSEANQEATKKVMEAVISDHGGSERCPWSAAEMKGIHIN